MDLLFLSEEFFLATNSPKEKQKLKTRVNLNSSVLEFDLHNILGLVRM